MRNYFFSTNTSTPRLSVSPRKLALAIAGTVLVLTGGATWQAHRSPGDGTHPAVYAALGASDTVGVGANNPDEEGWVPLVHASLPAGTQLLNLGISGAILADMLRQELPPALDARPRWVTLWTGVNDL